MTIKLTMSPTTGERRVCFVGDRLTFELEVEGDGERPELTAGFLRTTIGSGSILDDEIVRAFESSSAISHAAWHDMRMEQSKDGFRLSVLLSEPGFYRAKAYAVDPDGNQYWPEGGDFGVSVHPSKYRTANTIYCAWPRLFGSSKSSETFIDPEKESELKVLDEEGYSVIPPSGTLRDLKDHLGHIVDDLGCRILHLLPVNPTPTTFARFGRYGSPYASLDLTAIDPALVEFDKRATGVEQFCELTQEAHRKKASVFIDLVINHTGWGSQLYENYPEWFRRQDDGQFASPGAWGTVWEDLVELEHHDPKLGEELAEVFLTWCRRGVDGFRCDAGYMVPMPIWRYITARVRREYPNTIFLLEGLGGAWEVTEELLTEGGMQWAYSELFQNYSGEQVSWYTDYALKQSKRMGLYVNYSETHDNLRLAEKGKRWSLLRNRLCGLASVSGGFGFTCGVEWLAAEKIIVHQRSGLNWGSENNLVDELARLNELLAEHPCFFDGAELSRLSDAGSSVFALERLARETSDRVLALVNTDVEQSASVQIETPYWAENAAALVDLLGQNLPKIDADTDGSIAVHLPPGGAYCLGMPLTPSSRMGARYRNLSALRAWIVAAVQEVWPDGLQGDFELDAVLQAVVADPLGFLSAIRDRGSADPEFWNAAAERGSFDDCFPKVVLWEKGDERRVLPVPEGHWLVFRDPTPFSVCLRIPNGQSRTFDSVELKGDLHLVCLNVDREMLGRATVQVDRLQVVPECLSGEVEFLSSTPEIDNTFRGGTHLDRPSLESPIVLLTNGRGGMARLGAEFGMVKSKYDCLLGANLHPEVPVDRYVLAKRARLWVNAGGLITSLSMANLVSLTPGPPARWRYLICAGKGRWIPLSLTVDLMHEKNTLVIRCERGSAESVSFEEIEALYGRGNAIRARSSAHHNVDAIPLSLTVRVDIEDRGFHSETQRNSGSEHHFSSHTKELKSRIGFVFQPAADRRLEVSSDHGQFHASPEWSQGIPHVVEASRGQVGHGDAYSPGWFNIPLSCGTASHLVVSAEHRRVNMRSAVGAFRAREKWVKSRLRKAQVLSDDAFGTQLVKAASAFVVRRDEGMSVIAGYPWFLDWGRDSLICARGLLSCGYEDEVVQLLRVYGGYEKDGTLPNSIHGEDTSNRDTSDAPLWFGIVCRDLVASRGLSFLKESLDDSDPNSRTFGDVLRNIALGYLKGTPNGIRVDTESCLVWSPSHFTWMDTNHPPGTPREGYPVDIQVMWISLLRLLDKAGIKAGARSWSDLASQAMDSFEHYYWSERKGYYADLIVASPGQSAAEGTVDTALRSNFYLAISLGIVTGDRARRSVNEAVRHLMVPGGVRSLASLPVDVPLAVHGNGGQLLNDPNFPFWGRYEGDEDTRRKPAYHNGTVWGWPLGGLCEALLRAWDFSPEAKSAVRAYLGAAGQLLETGCLGQLPEVMDGDAPHTQRGCDAQAWSVTEAIRVWKMASS